MKVMIDPELPDHRKVWKLAALLEISEVLAVGHLVVLWCKIMRQSEDGILHKWTWEDVARAAGWTEHAHQFIKAMKDAGFIDVTEAGMEAHDWMDAQGALIARRKADRDRKRDVRRNSGDGSAEIGSPLPCPATPSPSLPRPARAGTVSAHLAQRWNEGKGWPCNPRSAQKMIDCALVNGAKGGDLEKAFLGDEVAGLKIWEYLNTLKLLPKGKNFMKDVNKRFLDGDEPTGAEVTK